MRKLLRRGAWQFVIAGALTLSSMPNSNAATADKNRTGQLEEVVVTAQRRAQPLQDVPLAVTVLQGQFLQKQHIVDFNDLALFTPNMVSAPNYGYIRDTSIRGISNNQFGFADDPSIAEFVDGIYQGRGGTGMMVDALYDVNRVEVVKGPQATLYGQSSIAGAINIIDNQPSTSGFNAYGDLGFGERDRIVLQGAVNLPISDDLATRIAEDVEHQNGFIRNLSGGPDLEPLDIRAVRFTTLYTGIDNVALSVKLDYERRKQSGTQYQAAGLPDFSTESSLVGSQAFSQFSIYDLVGTVKGSLSPNATLTANTSWRRVDNQYDEDYGAVAAIVAGPWYQQSADGLFQQDLIFNFQSDSHWTLVAGGSYFHEFVTAGVNNWVDGNPDFTGFAFTGVPTPGLLPDDYSDAFNEMGTLYGTFHGFSAFADGSAPLTDRLTLNVGVRYNSNTKNYTQDIPNPATAPINAGKIFAGAYYNWGYWTSQPITSEKTWVNTSGRAALTWKITPEMTAYGSWSQGWKAGGIDSFKIQWPGGVVPAGFNLFFGEDAAALGARPAVYNPEKNTSYEIGLKGEALEQTFGYDVDAYDYIYTDLQESVAEGGSSIIENVGRAIGRGVETDLRYVPTSAWTLFASAAYSFTRITSFSVLPDQVGQPLNMAPKYSGAAGISYRFNTPVFRSGHVELSMSENFRGRMRYNNQLFEAIPSYVLTNLRATYYFSGDQYSMSVFADNAFNRFTYSRYDPATPFLFPVTAVGAIGNPRTIGIDFGANW